MSTFFAAIEYVLYLYLVIVLARLVVECTRQFARSWRPVGAVNLGPCTSCRVKVRPGPHVVGLDPAPRCKV